MKVQKRYQLSHSEVAHAVMLYLLDAGFIDESDDFEGTEVKFAGDPHQRSGNDHPFASVALGSVANMQKSDFSVGDVEDDDG